MFLWGDDYDDDYDSPLMQVVDNNGGDDDYHSHTQQHNRVFFVSSA